MHERLYLPLFTLLLFAACTFAAEKSSEPVEESNAKAPESEAARIAGVEGQNYKITLLTPENLTVLAGKYPVIYGNLPNRTLYQIKTEKQLIIVDVEEKKVLRSFRVVNIELE